MKVTFLLAYALAFFTLFATAASAQNAPPTRIRGTITAIDGKTVKIATREGKSVDVKLADNWAVMSVSSIPASEIKQGSFVGIASEGTDANRTAIEVLVFPESARGTGEGHYPWDLKPQSMMTNATVGSLSSASDGQTLKLDYKGGSQTIKVKPGTPIVTFAPGDRADAKVGAKVFLGAAKAADGTLSAARLLVGKGGIAPPM